MKFYKHICLARLKEKKLLDLENITEVNERML